MEEQFNTWIQAADAYNKCPHCHSGILNRRVKRSFLVKNVFVWMDVKRYKCNVCAKKVYIKKDDQKSHSVNVN